MTIELPLEFEPALKSQANKQGVSVEAYVRVVLERELGLSSPLRSPTRPLKTGRGDLSHYGEAPSAEVIDGNRAEMFRNFGESL